VRPRPAAAPLLACVALLGVIGPHSCGTASPTASLPTPTVSAASSSAAPSTAEVARAVRGLVAQADHGFAVGSVTDVRLVRDDQGRWWAAASARPASSGLETPTVIMVRRAATWWLISYGTSPDMRHVPRAIRATLWPGWNGSSP